MGAGGAPAGGHKQGRANGALGPGTSLSRTSLVEDLSREIMGTTIGVTG